MSVCLLTSGVWSCSVFVLALAGMGTGGRCPWFETSTPTDPRYSFSFSGHGCDRRSLNVSSIFFSVMSSPRDL